MFTITRNCKFYTKKNKSFYAHGLLEEIISCRINCKKKPKVTDILSTTLLTYPVALDSSADYIYIFLASSKAELHRQSRVVRWLI